jgi:hypothetical protein
LRNSPIHPRCLADNTSLCLQKPKSGTISG